MKIVWVSYRINCLAMQIKRKIEKKKHKMIWNRMRRSLILLLFERRLSLRLYAKSVEDNVNKLTIVLVEMGKVPSVKKKTHKMTRKKKKREYLKSQCFLWMDYFMSECSQWNSNSHKNSILTLSTAINYVEQSLLKTTQYSKH